MCKLFDIKKFVILFTIMMMLAIPVFVKAGGHGGMGSMGMGGMGGHGSAYGYGYGGYGYTPTTTEAALLSGRYTPYPTVLGGGLYSSPYSYSPYRLGSVLGTGLGYAYPGSLGLGAYGLGGYGLGGYGLGGYGLGGYGLGGYGLGYPGGPVVTSKDYDVEQSYTTYVPGGAVTTTVSEGTEVTTPVNPYMLGNPFYGSFYGWY
jgi:hypothetical protein